MSMTKRYLESKPQAKQDAILGTADEEAAWYADAAREALPSGADNAEWMTDERKSRQFMGAMDLYLERMQVARVDSADNGPEEWEQGEEDLWWARMLSDEGDEQC